MCSGLDRLGARALFCGDAMHSPIQLRQPAVSISSCSGPEFATRTRIALLQEAAVTGRVFARACAPSYDAILPVPRGGWFRLFCSSQHIVEVQLKVAYHDYLEVGYAGHVSSPAKFE